MTLGTPSLSFVDGRVRRPSPCHSSQLIWPIEDEEVREADEEVSMVYRRTRLRMVFDES